jgi:hypothetical protein
MLPPIFFDNDKITTTPSSTCGIYQFSNGGPNLIAGISATRCTDGLGYTGIAIRFGAAVTTPCLIDGTVVPQTGVTVTRISNCTD